MKKPTFPWYLIFGLLVGLTAGLVYSWVISPVRYVDNSPATLKAEFKDQYRALIAVVYGINGDLGRAQARLALLNDASSAEALASQAQRVLAQGALDETADREVRSMALLAAVISGNTAGTDGLALPPTATQAVASAAPTEFVLIATTAAPTSTPTPTSLLAATQTPTPTATRNTGDLSSPTPMPTPEPLYELDSTENTCQSTVQEALLQVEVINAAGQPAPGVRLIISWDGGQNSFFTGLKPSVDLGYADFVMEPGVSYTLRVGDSGELVRDLESETCTDEYGQNRDGGIRVIFKQP